MQPTNQPTNVVNTKTEKANIGTLNDGRFAGFVKWIREPSKTNLDSVLKLSLLAVTVLGAASVIGLIVVIPLAIGVGIEWIHQVRVIQLNQQKTEESVPAENSNAKKVVRERRKNQNQTKTSSIPVKPGPFLKAPKISGTVSNTVKQPEKTGKTLPIVPHSFKKKEESALIPSSNGFLNSIPDGFANENVLVNINDEMIFKINLISLCQLLKSDEISNLFTNQSFDVKAYWSLSHIPKSTSPAPLQILNINSVDSIENESKPHWELKIEMTKAQGVNNSLESGTSLSSEPRVVELSDEHELNEGSSLESFSDTSSEDSPIDNKVLNPQNVITGSQATIEQDFSKNLSPIDEISLLNLAKIKENQIIDIYEDESLDGIVSEPYEDTEKENGYLWNAGLWFLGYGTNNEYDLAKIKHLMSRALDAYNQGSTSIKSQLEEALKGLAILKNHYESKNIQSKVDVLDEVIKYVEKSLEI